MAMNAIGGLAAGLAQGMNMGMQWRNHQEMIDLRKQEQGRLAKSDERDAEIHDLRKDQYASEKEVRDRRNNALRQIAEYTQAAAGNNQAAPAQGAPMQNPNAPSFGAPPEQQTPSNIKLAGPIPQGGLAMNAQAPFAQDNPAGALAPAQSAQQPQEAIQPAKVLERGMVTGAYTPKMLTDISNIFAQNGLHEEGIKYMNQAYEFEKRGGVRAGMALMQNNPGTAAEAMRNSGIDLEGLPVKVNPDDPNDMNWKINVKGQGEKTINARDIIRSNMDPEKFFEIEDKRRKEERDATMDERKQKNVERKTDAEIGFLRSRSQLAEARAENPGSGGLRSSRSSEASINTAIKRRDTSFDRVSSVKNEEGKFEVDPMKRQELDSRANQYMTFLEDQRGEELDSRDHHKFTDVMLSYPVGGSPEQIEKWQEKEFLPRFGIRRKARETQGEASGQARQAAPQARGLSSTAQSTRPKPNSLAALKERERARSALNQQMAGVQKALGSPNLDTNQKKALSLKAQEIASRRDALK